MAFRSVFRKPAMHGRDGEIPLIQRASSYSRIDLKRPAVVRRGNIVKTCYLHEGTGQCLGEACFWPRAGKCSFFTKLFRNGKKKK